MTSYLENIEEKNFKDLVDNRDFQVDLVKFFSGGRYKMSADEMRKEGIDSLADRFVEHMRYQSANEATALKDLNYVRNEKMHARGKQAFGNLMQAWDNSDGVGSGFLTGAGDYAEAIFTAPSTYLGLGSFGLSKLGAKAASKSAQIAVRNRIKDYFGKNVIAKGAATGAVTEGSIGYLQSKGAGEAREEVIEDYDYTTSDAIRDTAISGLFGAGLGAVGAKISNKKQINVDNLLTQQQAVNKANAKKASEAALKRIDPKKVNKASLERALKTVVDLEATLAAKKGDSKLGVLKDPLNPEAVERGNTLLEGMRNPDFNPEFSSGLSMTTIRSITAATVEVIDKLKIDPNKRITESVADFIAKDTSNIDIVENIRNKYNLSREQFSLIYLSELSRAGQVLGQAGMISRAAKKSADDKLVDQAKAARKTISASLDTLAAHGVSSIDDVHATEIAEEVIKNSTKGSVKSVYNFLQDLDGMRIAFMTSQPATTARNVTSTALLAGVELSDEFFRGLYRTITGQSSGGFVNTAKNMSATLRGMSMDSATATVVKDMLEEEMPETYSRVFHDTLRAEVLGGSQSSFAKAGRFVNMFNTATDTAFKQAAFFGSLDRQLREIGNEEFGTSVKEFILKKGKLDSLNDLDYRIVSKALDDANRFTMQRTYINDESLFGKGARAASSVNKKVPFLISGVVGVPFPRYVANHIEMIADYMPGSAPILSGLEKLQGSKSPNERGFFTLAGDPHKSTEDRFVRNATGIALITMGYQMAASKEGEIDYKSLESAIKGEADISSSLGFIIAPIYMGDLIYRKSVGLPIGDRETVALESGAVLGGLNDMGVDFTGVKELVKSLGEGEATVGLQKMGGNIASTFTYPSIFQLPKTYIDQLSYNSAGTSYTRPLQNEPEVTDAEIPEGFFANQATRFLPDYESIQYTQEFSFNKGYDIDYYTPFNPMPIGKMNPMKKTFTGIVETPTLTGIQREMNKLNIREFDAYKSTETKNAAVDYLVRQHMASKLYKEFDVWRKEEISPTSGTSYLAGQKYDDLNVEDKKAALLSFIKERKEYYKKIHTDEFTRLISDPKKLVQGRSFIRNAYFVDRAVPRVGKKGPEVYDQAASQYPGLEGKFKTSKELLADAESIEEELTRRLYLMEIVEEISDKSVDLKDSSTFPD